MQSARAPRRARTSFQAEFSAGDVQGKGKIKNVGEGGLFVETDELPPQGEFARIRFNAPTGPLVVSGMIWWTTGSRRQGGHGFGVRLLEANAEYDSMVSGLLRRGKR
jgi:hypothetical protein